MRRKKTMKTVAALLLTCLFVLPATAKYSGGSGPAQDPYRIATAADLIALGETPADYDKHFVLVADIDLDPNLPGRKVFDRAVIAPETDDTGEWWFEGTDFTGIFDGNEHTISHMTIRGGGYLGLFGYLSGEVRNLGAVGVNVSGAGDGVGGLVGENWGDISRCYSTGAVKGENDVGGLIGRNEYDPIGSVLWGGAPHVTDCFSTSSVTATGYSIGGLIGWNGRVATVSTCYSAGAVSGKSAVGGLIGSGSIGKVTACFWDVQTSGQAISDGGTGKTTTEMQTAKTFIDTRWDFVGETANGSEDIWKIAEGLGYPRLAWERYSGGTGDSNDPYQIATAADLIALGETPEDYDKHFILTADVDLDPNQASGRVFPQAVIPTLTGVFDGRGHRISRLTIAGDGNLGLLGHLTSAAEVKNLGLVDVKITSSGGRCGGLVGYNHGTVSRCYSTGEVTGSHDTAGGLVAANDGLVTQSYSAAVVIGRHIVGLVCAVGGLVGYNNGDVTHCYSTGPVSGGSDVGGLVGYNWVLGTVTQCFWDKQTSGQTTSAGGTGKTTADMQTESTFVCWVGDGTWTIDEGKDYPRFSWEKASGRAMTRSCYGGGSGGQTDPYLIYTAEQLNMIDLIPCDWNKHFKLMVDIDLSGFDGKHGRPIFNPIGEGALAGGLEGVYHIAGTPFTGLFDGNGHTISRLTVDNGWECSGLFSMLGPGGQVKNLGVVDVNVTSYQPAGALVGANLGTVTGCYSSGTLTGECEVGGLIGWNEGDLTYCYSTAAVSGQEGIGGLIGRNNGHVTGCFIAGAISGSGVGVGGLVGYGWVAHMGGSGRSVRRLGTVTASFWDAQTSGQATSAGGTGKTTAEMRAAKTFLDAGWDFVGETANGTADIWWILEGKDYPKLWWELTEKAKPNP
jgi:hypothetical protein